MSGPDADSELWGPFFLVIHEGESLPDAKWKFAFLSLGRLEYLHDTEIVSSRFQMSMILVETVRLYTPVPSIIREVRRELGLGKLVLPANMDILISTVALHHNADIQGEDAHIFNPERVSESVFAAPNNNTSTYSHSVRSLGRALALTLQQQ